MSKSKRTKKVKAYAVVLKEPAADTLYPICGAGPLAFVDDVQVNALFMLRRDAEKVRERTSERMQRKTKVVPVTITLQ